MRYFLVVKTLIIVFKLNDFLVEIIKFTQLPTKHYSYILDINFSPYSK